MDQYIKYYQPYSFRNAFGFIMKVDFFINSSWVIKTCKESHHNTRNTLMKHYDKVYKDYKSRNFRHFVYVAIKFLRVINLSINEVNE